MRDLATAPWVYVVEGGRARRLPIRVGIDGDGAVEVLDGLAEDARVVPAEVDVSDGQRVRLR